MDIVMDEWTPERIKALRIALKLTQKAFSERIGVTDIYANYLERGVRTPSRTLKLLLNYVERDLTEKENENGKEVRPDGEKEGRQKNAPRKGNL
jgi:transcriptional regulator with XRE-family HTH domain